MSPAYLNELADLADPDQLWRLRGIDQMELPPEKRKQLDTGVALRRHASHLERLATCLAEQRSLLITPLSSNSSAQRHIDTPSDHAELRRWPR